MTLSTAVEKFLLENRPRLSRQTYVNYQSDLGLLTSLAKVYASDSVFSFTQDLVRRFFAMLSEKNLSMATLHRRRATLNEFAKWGQRERLWHENPMLAAPRIKRPRTLPRPFSGAERKRLLALDLPLQERCVRAILYYTGVRVGELCAIRVEDCLADDLGRLRQIRIHGKGRKERVVYVVPELAEVLRDYLLTTDLRAKTFVFSQHEGRPWTRKMVNKRLRAWGETAGVPTCTPHRWRHTTATAMLERGGDIRKIQKVMGHADLSTTAIYADVVDRQAEETAMLLSDRPAEDLLCNPPSGGEVTGPSSVPPPGSAA